MYETCSRHQAPEAIADGVFTVKTDVWSMGTTLWEAFAYGAMPYPGMSNQEVVLAVPSGFQLPSPAGCPSSIYSIMRQCWCVRDGVGGERQAALYSYVTPPQDAGS